MVGVKCRWMVFEHSETENKTTLYADKQVALDIYETKIKEIKKGNKNNNRVIIFAEVKKEFIEGYD